MNVVPMSSGEAHALALAAEGLWADLMTAAAPNVALMSTLAAELTPDEMAKLFGPDLLDEARALLHELRNLHRNVALVENGTAVLVPWREGREPVISIAIVRRNMLPPGADLAAWPIVAAAAAIGVVVITAGAVIVKAFDTYTQNLKSRTADLRVKMFERMATNAEAIRATDPAFAAKLLDAAGKATAAEVTAAGQGKSWLDRFFGGIAAGAGAGLAAPLVVALLAFLFFATQGARQRRAA